MNLFHKEALLQGFVQTYFDNNNSFPDDEWFDKARETIAKLNIVTNKNSIEDWFPIDIRPAESGYYYIWRDAVAYPLFFDALETEWYEIDYTFKRRHTGITFEGKLTHWTYGTIKDPRGNVK